jgi:hypothetical protein
VICKVFEWSAEVDYPVKLWTSPSNSRGHHTGAARPAQTQGEKFAQLPQKRTNYQGVRYSLQKAALLKQADKLRREAHGADG